MMIQVEEEIVNYVSMLTHWPLGDFNEILDK